MPLPARRPTTTLPARRSNALTSTRSAQSREVSLAGDNWHFVKDLPGYQTPQVRQIMDQVLGPFKQVPIEQVKFISTLTDEKTMVGKMIKRIMTSGQPKDKASLNFDRLMPGYSADVELWQVGENDYLLTKDFAGYYIYTWPANDKPQIGQEKPALPAPPGQLRGPAA